MLVADSTEAVTSLAKAGEANLEHLQEQAVAAVLVGRFEPGEFDIDGLVSRKLVSEERREAALIDVMHPELTRLSAAGLTFDVTRERMSMSARAEPFVRLMDLVRTASEREDAGLRGIIFVYAFQFRVADHHQQSVLGRQLAPMAAWGDTARLFEAESALPGGGLSSLTLQRTVLDGGPGTLKVTVQPSPPTGPGPGVFMQIERSFVRTDPSRDGIWFAQSCIDQYDSTLRLSKGIVRGMMNHARTL